MIVFRMACPNDLPEMKQLYADTIRTVCMGEYTERELEVWSSSSQKTERWQDMIANQWVILAEMDNQLVGFASLKAGDYIDFFYVHKDFQRYGIATQLLQQIENKARESGIKRLSSDISKTAQPFFEKNGYAVIREQRNVSGEVMLVNYQMEKRIFP